MQIPLKHGTVHSLIIVYCIWEGEIRSWSEVAHVKAYPGLRQVQVEGEG